MRLWLGIVIIIIFFVGGFIMMITGLGSGDMGIGMILFYIFVIPLIGVVIGVPLMLKGIGQASFGMFKSPAFGNEKKDSSYIHEPPDFCKNCGGTLSAGNVEWAGPLTVKCPYCGVTMKTVKREV
ncbi:MAG: hypothetical protein R6V83_14045 [Candidatus Thorarchaeota archaeon]